MDLGLEAAFEVLSCPDSVAVDQIAAREAVISHFQAEQMQDMRAVSLDQPPEEYRGKTFAGRWSDSDSVQFWTQSSSSHRVKPCPPTCCAPRVFR